MYEANATRWELPFPVPAELRAGVESIVDTLDGAQPGLVIGDQTLAELLRLYRQKEATDSSTLVALFADESAIGDALTQGAYVSVLSLHAASLYFRTRRFRKTTYTARKDRQQSAWLESGFARVSRRGIQGPSSIAWLAAGLIARRLNRPDIGDRCRIMERRSLISHSRIALPSTLCVSHYRIRAS